jgi:NAD(P)-dependent dehydrogenase (short-subunit alcohol dehydrogenase family)
MAQAAARATGCLDGKIVWVTGAGRGLGRSIAAAAAGAGATVVASSRTAADLRSLGADVRATGGELDERPLSVAEPDAVDAVAAAIVAAHGRIDGLVTSAGVSPVFVRSEQVRDQDWQTILDVNLTGTFACARAAGRLMLAQGNGSIVAVSSVHARVGYERLAAYAASKGGVEALIRTLAVEWAARGVRVNSLVPGYFATDLSAGLLNSRHGERIRAAIPMGRIGAPGELDAAALFLLSDASSYVTGSSLSVDGGWQAW